MQFWFLLNFIWCCWGMLALLMSRYPQFMPVNVCQPFSKIWKGAKIQASLLLSYLIYKSAPYVTLSSLRNQRRNCTSKKAWRHCSAVDSTAERSWSYKLWWFPLLIQSLVGTIWLQIWPVSQMDTETSPYGSQPFIIRIVLPSGDATDWRVDSDISFHDVLVRMSVLTLAVNCIFN